MATDAIKTPDDPASQGLAIRAANESERDQIVALIVLAFSADPIVRWGYPDPHQFLSSFPVLVRAFGGKPFEHGTAYLVEGFTGAALWLPPEVHPDEEALGSVLIRTVPEERHEEMFGVLEQMGSYQPTEPHWYLPMIGVEPAHQGKGYGSALLGHTLEICDRHHPCRAPGIQQSQERASLSTPWVPTSGRDSIRVFSYDFSHDTRPKMTRFIPGNNPMGVLAILPTEDSRRVSRC